MIMKGTLDTLLLKIDALYLCLTVPPVVDLGATALDGDRLPEPTVVELGGAGWNLKFVYWKPMKTTVTPKVA